MNYIATFFTHLSAAISCRALKSRGVDAALMPVPRKLSSSCGTCVRYTAEEPLTGLLDQDVESVARVTENGDYDILFKRH